MTIAVTSILPVVTAQGVASDVAFQPGSVVAARVLAVGADNQVRIAIGNSSIDVQSQVPLQPGQVLQLAVSQTADGAIRLAVMPAANAGLASDPATPATPQLSLASLQTAAVAAAPAAW